MKNAIIFVIALAVSNFACAPSPAQNHGKYAAPFGLDWGLSKEQLTAMGVELTPVEFATGAYTATNLPKKLSDAKTYTLQFKQEFGLVAIGVITYDIPGDPLGLKGKERYSQLKTAIVNKYGKPDNEFEWSGRARLYDDRHEFYQCLRYGGGCGAWTSVWGSDTDGVIGLQIKGRFDGRGYIILKYESAAFYIDAE